MSILCTGSIAIDQIMVFPDHFKNHILPEKIDSVNVSFYVPSLEKRYGGTGANIAYHVKILGIDPILLATVGSDFGAYAQWMDDHGIRRNWIKTFDDVYTSQCFITTDLDHNQINSFYPGAMERSHEATLASVDEDFSVGIVSPNGKQGMIDYAAALKAAGKKCVIDPGQAMGIFDGEELTALLDGASVYIVNDYEWETTKARLELDEDAIADKVGALVVTLGERGSWVRRGGRDLGVAVEAVRTEIQPVAAEEVVDPTGCGDAYRAGLLSSLTAGRSVEHGARIGAVMGALKVARSGPQSISEDLAAIGARFEREFHTTL
ncbi:MAG: carbohydrate kinase family protein [Myxococcota bacterium]